MQYFNTDSLSILMLGALAVVLVPVLIHSLIYFRDFKATAKRTSVYFAALAVLTAALAFGYTANHIVLTWVFTEITTLAAGVLIYHHRDALALEAVWKYIFVCAISVTLIFVGILFWSLALIHCGSSDLSYANLTLHQQQMNPLWLKLGYIFIFAGFTAKMGLFPMFTAGIDANDNAPSPVSAMLSAPLVNLGFTGIYRSYAVLALSPDGSWARVMMVATALLTLFIATTYMVKIRNYKRMLAYSSIEHSALVILGICFGKAGIMAALLHLLMHSLVKSGLFLQMPQLAKTYGTKMMDSMGGYLKLNPTGALTLLLGLFSITAIPPSGMFITELKIFIAMLASGHWYVMVLCALFLTVLIWAICKSIISVIFLPMAEEDELKAPKIKVSPAENICILILFIGAIYLGYFCPGYINELISDASGLIF